MQQTPLRYPKKSHRKTIRIPSDDTSLAELVGILFGDGGIGNKWQVIISLNSIADLDYSYHVSDLIERLFGLTPSIRKRPNQNTLVIACSSINLLHFLLSKGVVNGDKVSQGFSTPEWISKNPNFKKSFIRGLIDTDGCLYIHKHTVRGKEYNNLGLCFTSYSKKLLSSVASILEEFDIKPHISNQNRSIYLYSYKSVLKYLDTFGSSNPRILRKYDQWRGRLVV